MRERAVKLGRKILTHELVTGSTFIFLGTTVANIFAFLFNLLLVRSFSYAEYAEYATLISLFALLSIPAQSLQPVLVRFSSEFIAMGKTGKAKRFYNQTLTSLIAFSIIFFATFSIVTPLLKEFFHTPNILPSLMIGLTICLAYLSVPNTSFLQSMLAFPFLAFTTALGSFTKLLIGILVILFGFHVLGSMWAVFLSFLIPFIISFIPLRGFFARVEGTDFLNWKDIFSYGLPSAVALFALSSFTATDVLLVKHFFSTNTAGLYAGLSLIGKVIFYFTAPISTVMFPLVIKKYEEGRNFHSVFYLALALVFLPSFGITLFYFLLPHLAISIFLGQKYQVIAPFLGYFGIILCLYSVLNITVNFYLSLKKTKVVYLLSFGAILQAVLITLFHASFLQIISITIMILLVLLILLLLYYSKQYVYSKSV